MIKWGMLKRLEIYWEVAREFQSQFPEHYIELVGYDTDPADPIQAIKNGEIDIYQIESKHLRHLTHNGWLTLWEVPFLFESPEHVEAYINSQRAKDSLKLLENDEIMALTYSYAGGFSSVVRECNGGIGDLNNLNFVVHNYDFNKLSDSDLEEIREKMPFSILQYETHELLDLGGLMKDTFLEVTDHLVTARVTIVSKRMLESLGDQKEAFLFALTSLLAKERSKVYARAAKNLETIKDSQLGHRVWDKETKEKYFNSHVERFQGEVINEIEFVRTLPRR